MRLRKTIETIAFLLPFFVSAAYSQGVPEKEIDVSEFAEELFALQDDDVAYEDLYESLLLLYTHPLNLNSATYDELSSLLVLSPTQVSGILNYRQLNGPFISIYELQAVAELDQSTIEKILPFVTLSPPAFATGKSLFQRVAQEKNSFLILRAERTLEKQKGYTPADTNSAGDPSSRYLGSPLRQYARFRVSHTNDFSLGFTAEKDAGEQWQWHKKQRQYGFDYYSFHAQVKNKGRFKSIAIGDYQVQMGQGLVFGAGFSAGKGSETILSAKKNSLGILPYSSVVETGFFRGAAVTWKKGLWEFTGLTSRMRQDGTVKTDTIDDNPYDYISSVLGTGLHRTANELASKNQIIEYGAGGAVLYRNGPFQAGVNSLYTQFSTSIQRGPQLYNQFEFAGKTNLINSAHLSYLWQNMHFFGEAARSASGGTGLVGGMLLSLTGNLGLSVVGRSYSRDFHSFYSRSFGENTRNINEHGIYWGIKWKLAPKIVFSAYYDTFSFPWLRFNADAPGSGTEYLGMISYNISKLTKIYGQYRQQTKPVNGGLNEFYAKETVDGVKQNVMLNLDHDNGGIVALKSRLQLSRYTQSGIVTSGFAIIQDINFDFQQLKLGSRFAIFDTEDYANRQYVYEKDVLYSFSIPAYSGSGIRTYVLMEYRLTSKITAWLRWGRFLLPNAENISTSLQQINGTHKNDLKFQLRIFLH